MLEDYYKFNANPFRLGPDDRFRFVHESYTRAKAYLRYGLDRAEGFVLVTGAPGTGKTTLIEDVISEVDPAKVTLAYLVSTQLEAEDLLCMLAAEYGIDTSDSDKGTLLNKVNDFLVAQGAEGRQTLLVLDEAQGLPRRSLEELRMLANLQSEDRSLFQIFLVGQEKLRKNIQGPDMEQLRQRVIASCHLEAMTAQETEQYIKYRLGVVGWNSDPELLPAVFPLIHYFTGGVPRRVNHVMNRLFLYGEVEETHQFDEDDVWVVLEELQDEPLMSFGSSLPLKVLQAQYKKTRLKQRQSAEEAGAEARANAVAEAEFPAEENEERESLSAEITALSRRSGKVEARREPGEMPRFTLFEGGAGIGGEGPPMDGKGGPTRELPEEEQRRAQQPVSPPDPRFTVLDDFLANTRPSAIPPTKPARAVPKPSLDKRASQKAMPRGFSHINDDAGGQRPSASGSRILRWTAYVAVPALVLVALILPNTQYAPAFLQQKLVESKQLFQAILAKVEPAPPAVREESALTASTGIVQRHTEPLPANNGVVEDAARTARPVVAPEAPVPVRQAQTPIASRKQDTNLVKSAAPPRARETELPATQPVASPGQVEPDRMMAQAALPPVVVESPRTEITPRVEEPVAREPLQPSVLPEEPPAPLDTAGPEPQMVATVEPVIIASSEELKAIEPPQQTAPREDRTAPPDTAGTEPRVIAETEPVSVATAAKPKAEEPQRPQAAQQNRPAQRDSANTRSRVIAKAEPETKATAAKPIAEETRQQPAIQQPSPVQRDSSNTQNLVTAKASPTPVISSAQELKAALLAGQWTSGDKPATLLPSGLNSCRDRGETIACQGLPRTTMTKHGKVLYQVEGTLDEFTPEGNFQVHYRTKVALIKPANEATGQGSQAAEYDWQISSHLVMCHLAGKNIVRCSSDKGGPREYRRSR